MLRSQYAILGEHFREGPHGKFDILGPFDRVFAQGVPTAQSLVFVAQVVATTEDDLGKHRLRLYAEAPDKSVIVEQHGEFVMKPEGGAWLAATRMVFGFNNFPLLNFGRYRFVLEVDGKQIADHPLQVSDAKHFPKIP